MNKIISKLCYLFAVCLSVGLLFFVVSCTWIGYEVKNNCQNAKNKYAGDCVEALINTLNDESQSYANRNSAIWALGQIGDSKALPALEKIYTGNIPDREPWNETVSQYELRKAINLTKGAPNPTAIFWRTKSL